MYLFDLGENIIINDIRKGELKINKIKANFPGRIECEIMDFSKMHAHCPGGGGYGFPVDLENYIEIEISESESINTISNKTLIKHWLMVIKKALSIKENFNITIRYDDFLRAHSGLGSSASTAIAICYLINYMYGNVYTEDELIKIVAYNYAEEYEDKLTRTPLTCVSLYSMIRGKFVVVDGDINLVYEKHIMKDYKLFLINTNMKRILSEHELGLKIKKEEIEKNINRKEIIYNNIIPELEKDNWNELFKYNNIFQQMGIRKTFIENYVDNGKLIKQIIEYFNKQQNVMAGLTSVGPTIYILTLNPNIVEDYCKLNNLKYKQFELSNGIKIFEKVKKEQPIV